VGCALHERAAIRAPSNSGPSGQPEEDRGQQYQGSTGDSPCRASTQHSVLESVSEHRFSTQGGVQEYIAVLEKVSEARRRDIITLKSDSRRAHVDIDRLRKQASAAPVHGELFCAKESSVLPGKVRAIVEDNRVLKEKAKKFRDRCSHWKEVSSRLTSENARLQKHLAECKKDLQNCSIAPEEFNTLRVRLACLRGSAAAHEAQAVVM
jgi:chromosome segregation ATPase